VRFRLLVCMLLIIMAGTTLAQEEISGNLDGVLEEDEYLMTANCFIQAGDSLIIEPGTIILSEGRFYFIIYGYLEAIGTEEDTIYFSHDGEEQQWWAYWMGVYFFANADDNSRMEYCHISNSYTAALKLYNDATIDHCTITGGDAQNGAGGGILVQGTATITNCTITGNDAGYGGGICINADVSPVITNCTITGNTANSSWNRYGEGGGIYVINGSPIITGCKIENNDAERDGGGIYLSNAAPVITGTEIVDNSCDDDGGGIYGLQSDAELYSCIISENNASGAGGGLCFIDNSDPEIEGCLISGNSANSDGGGIFIDDFTDMEIDKTTISGNDAPDGGGIFIGEDAELECINSILEGSTNGEGLWRDDDASTLTFRYNTVYNHDDGNFEGQIPDGIGDLTTINANYDSSDVYYNIYIDPQLIDPVNGDYGLEEGSPAVDAGDPESSLDPDSTVADMGAFPSFQERPLPFHLLSPEGGDTCHTLDTTLTWDHTWDINENDVPHYDVWLDTTEDLSTAWQIADSSADSTIDVNNLLDDHTYYWTVRATDSNTEGTWSKDTLSVVAFLNEAPGAFSLDSPEDGANIEGFQATVYWDQSTDPDNNDMITYWVEWSLDEDFEDFETASTADDQYTISGLNDNDEIYWRVKAVDRLGAFTYATPEDGWSFTVGIADFPSAFNLISPGHNDTTFDGDQTFVWESTTDPDGDDIVYKLWVSLDQNFVWDVDSVSTTDTSYTFENLDDDENYYWKVRAQDDNTVGRWSNQARRLRVYIPESPGNFVLFSPSSNQRVYDDTVTVVWLAANDPDPHDVITYTVQWSTQGNFANYYEGTTTDNFYLITDLEDQQEEGELDELPDNTRIFWRVRATDSFDNSRNCTPTGGWNFQVFMYDSPNAFSLISPADGDTSWTGDTTFTWEDTQDPDPGDFVFYRLYWSTDDEFSDADSATTFDTEYDLEDLEEDNTYWWRVRAQDQNTNGTLSDETFRLSVYFIDEPEPFSLLSPGDGDTITADTARMAWETAIDPDPDNWIEYKLWWATDANFTQNLDSISTGDTTYTLTNLADETTFYWKVRAQDNNTSGVWSDETWSFWVNVPEPPSDFDLAGPADESLLEEDEVTVYWDAATDPDNNDPTTYHVDWSLDSGFDGYYTGSTSDTFFAITDLEDLVGQGELDELPDNIQLFWRVRARDNYGLETYGTPEEGWSFYLNYEDDPPAAFNLLFPEDGDTNWTGNTDLSWQSTTDPDPGDEVEGYMIWWATNENFTEALDSAFTIDTSYALADLSDDETYWWKVRALDGNTNGTWSTQTRQIHVFFTDPPGDFDLSSPENNTEVHNPHAVVRWTTSIDPDPGDHVTYTVEWSENDDFTESSISTTADTSFDITDLEDEVTYYWRVKATDRFDNETYADPEDGWSFDVIIYDPPTDFSLLSPSDGDTCWTGDTTFTWEESTDPDLGDDVIYWLWWATNDEFTQNLDSSSTTDTTLTINNLEDNVTHWWKVRAQDDNTEGTWSDETNTLVVYIIEDPGAFSLSSPANTSTINVDNVTLAWTTSIDPDPNDEITYTVEWSQNDDFTGSSTANLTDTTYSITGLDDEETYYWRVKVTDSFDNEVYATPTDGWSFDVYIFEPPSSFSLVSPENGDTTWTGDTTFTWEQSNDPDTGDNITYKIWWATDSNFTQDLDSASSANTSIALNDFSDDTQYWWKVRAQDTNTTGTWSDETYNFHVYIPDPPEDFELASPDDGEQFDDDIVTVAWTASSDTDPGDWIYYTVEWSTDEDFGESYTGTTTDTFLTITDLEDLVGEGGLDELPDDITVYWHVKVTDQFQNDVWADPEDGWSFSIYIFEPPEAFSLISPDSTDTSWTDDVILDWEASSDPDPGDDVDSYKIWWATDQNFTQNLDSASTPNTGYTIPNLDDDTIYWWKVRAQDSNTNGTWSNETYQFTVYVQEDPEDFSLLEPGVNDTCWSGDTTLTWEVSTDPDPNDSVRYVVWWATNSGFTQNLDSVSVDSTSYYLSGLNDDTQYWWKVRAVDIFSNNTWSDETHRLYVYIPEAPEDFDLLSPSADTLFNTDTVTVVWEPSSDNDPGDDFYYLVEWSEDSLFTLTYEATTTDTFLIITGLEDQIGQGDLDELPDDATVYWRVTAIDNFGLEKLCTPNAGWRFHVLYVYDPPADFSLLYPGTGDTCWTGDTTLTWEVAVETDPLDTTNYAIFWATNSNFTQNLDSAFTIDTTYALTNLTDNAAYWWKIHARDNNTEGTWSDNILDFDVYIPEAPGSFDLSSPDSGSAINDEAVTVSWTTSTDPDPNDQVTYTLEWAVNANFDNSSIITTSNTSYEITGIVDDATIYWRVTATDIFGLETDATPSNGWSFDIFVYDPPAAFSLLTPGSGDTCWTGDTTITWEATTDPDPNDNITYKVWWATDANFTQNLDSASTTGTTRNLANLIDDETYWWKVRAQDENTEGTWSDETFTINVFIPDVPNAFSLTSPDDGVTCWTGDTTLTWETATDSDPGDAITYKVWWATNSAFTQNLDSASTNNTQQNLTGLTDDETYWWKVRAQDNYTVGTWSDETWSFEVYIPENPATFVLSSPPNNSQVHDDTVTVVWTSSDDNDPDDELYYEVEWGIDGDDDTYTATTTDTFYTITDLEDMVANGEIDELPDDTAIRWKVKAIDEFNNETSASPQIGWLFNVYLYETPQSFSLTNPGDGDTCWTGDTTFTWEAAVDPDPDDEITYTVFWATDSDLTEDLDSASTTNTSLDVTNLTDDETIWWTVRARDPGLLESWADDTLSIVVYKLEAPVAFSLDLPEDGVQVNNDTVVVSWTASSDPDPGDFFAYRVDWSENEDFEDNYTNVTTQTFFTITDFNDLDELPDDTTVYWRVKAFDNYGFETQATPAEGFSFDVYLFDPPGEFSLSSPANDDTCWSGDTTLTWEASIDPDPGDEITYWVWWATDSDFTENLDSASTTDTDYDLGGLSDLETYWWTVRAQDENTVGIWSNDTSRFFVYIPDAPLAFSLATPDSGEIVHDDSILVSWSTSLDDDPDDSVSYRVEWSGISNFDPYFSGTTTDTFFVIPDLGDIDELPDDTTVYWRVVAEDSYNLETSASPVDGYSFDIFIYDPPLAFNLLTPEDSDTCWDGDTTVTWEATTDPDPGDTITYVLMWALDQNFTQPVDSVITDTTTADITGLGNAIYWWNVRAQDTNTDGTWGNEARRLASYSPLAPSEFSLASPDSGSLFDDDTVTVSWHSSEDPNEEGISYNVIWSLTEDFSDYFSGTTDDTFFVITALEDLLPEGPMAELPDDIIVHWRVIARNTYNLATLSTPSTGWTFEIYMSEPPAAFDLIPSEEDTNFTGEMNLTWHSTIDPDPGDSIYYSIWFSSDSLFLTGVDSTSTPDTSGVITGYEDNSYIWWKVRAQDLNTTGTWSNQALSFVSNIPNAPDAFSVISPLNGGQIHEDIALLIWEPAIDTDLEDSVSYYLEISLDQSFIISIVETLTDTTYELDDISGIFMALNNKPPGNGNSGSIAMKNSPGIEHQKISNNANELLSLNSARNIIPGSSPGMTPSANQLQGNNSNIRGRKNADSRSSETDELDGLPDDLVIYWRVRAIDTYGLETFVDNEPDGVSFQVYIYDPPAAFDLVSPEDGQFLEENDITLSWQRSRDVDPGDNLHYVVWYSTSSTFSSNVDSAVVNSISLRLPRISDDHEYFWKVRAQDTNTEGTWSSQTNRFYLAAPREPLGFSLLTPAVGDTVWNNEVQVIWESIEIQGTDAEQNYKVWWSTNPSFASDSGFVNFNTVADTCFTITELEDDTQYWWKVLALGDDDTDGEDIWSRSAINFDVYVPEAPAPISLLELADRTEVDSKRIRVTWSSSTDIDPGDRISYRVEWSADSLFAFKNEEVTSDTSFVITGYSLDDIFDDITIYWRVCALDLYGMETMSIPANGWSFDINVPEEPVSFELVSPVNARAIPDSVVYLIWESTYDPDPYDTLTFNVMLDTLPDMLNSWMLAEDIAETTFTLADPLINACTYYWSVYANDSNTEGTWAEETQSFYVPFSYRRFNQWAGIPESFDISTIFPNPFNANAQIVVGLPNQADLIVYLYNSLGRKVAEIANGGYNAGYHRISYNAGNLSSGIYFVTAIVPGETSAIRKIVLVK